MNVRRIVIAMGLALLLVPAKAEEQTVAYFAGPNSTLGNINAWQWVRTGVRFTGEARRHFTFEIWVNPQRNSYSYLLSQYGANEGRQQLYLRSMKVYANMPGVTGANMTSKNTVALNTWTHIAWVVDNDKWRIYINGVLDSESTGHGSHLLDQTSTDGIMIANDSTDKRTGYCCAYLAEARVWMTSRTQQEIADNMYTRIADPWADDDLFGYWPLNDGESAFEKQGRAVKNYTNMDATQYGCDWLEDYQYMYASGTNIVWVTSDLPVTGDLPSEDNALSFKNENGLSGAVNTQISVAPANFTFLGWFLKSASDANTKNVLFSKAESGNGRMSLIEQNGELIFTLGGGTGGATNETASIYLDSKWPRYSWKHLAITKSGSVVRFYLNGEKVGEYGGFTLTPQTNPFIIGGSSANGYSGLMKSVGVWSRVLSQDDIRKLMKARPRNESTMIGFWPMNDGSGDELTNLRKNGVPGKPVSGSFTWCKGAAMPGLSGALMNLGILLMYH